MKKKMRKVSDLMGLKGRPTMALYKMAMEQLPEQKAEQLNKELFRLSFGYWSELPDYYRRFFLRLYVHDRELLLRYALKETPLGELRYKLRKPELFIKLLHIMEIRTDGMRPGSWQLAMCLLLAFDIDYTFRTLGTYLRRPHKTIQPNELLAMMGKLDIEDDLY